MGTPQHQQSATMPVLKLIVLGITLYTLNYLRKLHTNYKLARSTHLNVVISPLDPYGMIWQLTQPLLNSYMRLLPERLSLWFKVMDMGWSWELDDYVHRKLGSSFVVVSAERNVIYTCDKEAVQWVLGRRKDFLKPDVYEALDIFGRNVDTVNGDDWSRHRKLTAPCFNERVSSLVWDESLRQGRSMLSHWLSQGKISDMVDDTRTLALHVLSAAGFGVSHDFLEGNAKPAEGHLMSHRDALTTILRNLVTSIVLSQMPWAKRVVPKKLKDVCLAISEFRLYMDELLASEREVMRKEKGFSKPNLISTLIRTSDEAKAEGVQSAVRLTDEEIKGNIFIFNLAGHDTTANSLAYALTLLALHPEIQAWVVEEVDEVMREENSEYESLYPRLKRVQAVLYETLRLYGPVPNVPRAVSGPNKTLQLTCSSSSPSSTYTLSIPPNTSLNLSLHAAHTNAAYYPDPTSFKPSRWIKSTSSPSSLQTEELLPQPPSFNPWSSGPRICPGMKFAQVEFAAVLAILLHSARVSPALRKDGHGPEYEERARKEVYGVMRDSALNGPTLSMNRPEDLWLKIAKR
ncbi:cytochrome P450 [Lophiotrema nucula]|uniref:Cytochrome P450 n=1 Tax=Lophiotrema nucula TaxID=690887 RepID=A0A6A5YP83_9PLEO|nr:cytochrome P450 [Lophiotrema nucula]